MGVDDDADDISPSKKCMCRLNGRHCFIIIDIEIAINRKTTKELNIISVLLRNRLIT